MKILTGIRWKVLLILMYAYQCAIHVNGFPALNYTGRIQVIPLSTESAVFCSELSGLCDLISFGQRKKNVLSLKQPITAFAEGGIFVCTSNTVISLRKTDLIQRIVYRSDKSFQLLAHADGYAVLRFSQQRPLSILLNLTTGETIWTTAFEGEVLSLSSNRVSFVKQMDEIDIKPGIGKRYEKVDIRALNCNLGTEIWRRIISLETPTHRPIPKFYGNGILWLWDHRNIYGLSETNGNKVASFSFPDSVGAFVFGSFNATYAIVSHFENVVGPVTETNRLFKINGEHLIEMGLLTGPVTVPLLWDDEHVLFIGPPIRCLNMKTQKQIWEVNGQYKGRFGATLFSLDAYNGEYSIVTHDTKSQNKRILANYSWGEIFPF